MWCAACAFLPVAADEQARLAALRAQLGALEQEKAGEFEARIKGMQDLSAALQVRVVLLQMMCGDESLAQTITHSGTC